MKIFFLKNSEPTDKINPLTVEATKILIVENFEPTSMVTEEFLSECGYNSDSVMNGKEAIKAVMSGQYFLILMDLQMYGMNGFEATKKIREMESEGILNRHYIIGMTGHSESEKECYLAGMDNYLSKPFELRFLKAKLQNILISLKRF